MTLTDKTDVYYDPFDPAINADPYPTFRRLRDEAPVYYNERFDFWALSPLDLGTIKERLLLEPEFAAVNR